MRKTAERSKGRTVEGRRATGSVYTTGNDHGGYFGCGFVSFGEVAELRRVANKREQKAETSKRVLVRGSVYTNGNKQGGYFREVSVYLGGWGGAVTGHQP